MILEELYRKLMEHNKKIEEAKTYNFFETTKILKSELIICRFIADLLNPKGNHKLGSVGLRLFMQQVFGEEYEDEYYQHFTVSTEYVLENRRRIDIVIEGNGRFLPIEVKIDAKDQENQCYDYLEYAREIDPEAKIIYLTKNETKPSDLSRCSCEDGEYLDDEDIICISFKRNIVRWMKNIVKETGNDLNGLLTQYVQAIERSCGIMEQEEQKMLTEYILDNEQRLFTTVKLSKAIESAKCELLYWVFEELEEAIDAFICKPENEKYGIRKEENFNYCTYKDQIDRENGDYGIEPGINYVFENIVLKKKRQVWLRIACAEDGLLFVGILVIDPEQQCDMDKFLVSSENTRVVHEVQNLINLRNIDYEDLCWIWEYLPNGTRDYTDQVPDFDEMNQAAIELVNSEKRKALVEKSIKVIREMLEEITETTND